MAFFNIAGLDWSEVTMVGWFGVNCESSEADQSLKWGGGHDHGEGELRVQSHLERGEMGTGGVQDALQDPDFLQERDSCFLS